ncbi:MAG: SMP-30/gluconolactonase/LRE family protein [Gemmatimonadetes bacterium]|jgi:sugar lactone lactonase YvrE|nr:SMP-30/gluconolactonase/LRE family protein [Gemmatimonadota bacterium]MBT5058096.1 SMP-30/gluconolactonase/LRE family protein [Gemmatimonadota bacterium]MBT5141763.1 SMP-30/gluconolactonase/LRE family protein [Gemmatimonadota bacterium]MBT5591066.1 SMP-30/gluconolactonase/LRE family protein [Gemmatimonadota bacterium]MBT5962868.1 SMP-30/gluconolactonase/LRE family protein [Gemmatimonadota bacterium]
MSDLYKSTVFTQRNGFTRGIEGPGCDKDGNLYAVNYEREHTIGKVTPEGVCSIFLELPEGSTGNGIRFDSHGRMYIADYTGHNVLRVDMGSRDIEVFAHEASMNQPNDIAMGADDVIYASDPNWGDSTGQMWRIEPDGSVHLLEADMGTTNGIEVSPGEDLLYVNESVQRTVWAYDLAGGVVSNKRLLIEFPDHAMDGMRCDVEGNLYITRHGKGTIAKISPAGDLLEEIGLTGKLASNIAFGGSDGCTAYVTLQDEGNVEVFRVDAPGRAWQLAQR